MNLKRRKGVSKKNKKAWRKHTDVKDVESYLDHQRLQERLGVPVAQKKDEELFVIDNKAQFNVRNGKRKLSNNENDKSQLKCYQSLENTSAVSDPLIKRNRVRTKEERQHPILKKQEQERRKKGILKQKERFQLQKLLNSRIKKFNEKHKHRIDMKKDVWSDKPEIAKIHKLNDWIDENTIIHNIRNTRGIVELSNYRPAKPISIIPAFEAPDPGISYNPTLSDHISLINKIAKSELNEQKKESHLHRVTNPFFKKVSAAENERMWLDEMSQGLPIAKLTSKTEEEDPVEVEMTVDYKPVNPPVTRNKKTRTQRNKQRRLKLEELDRAKTKEDRKKYLDVCRIKLIQKEIEEEELKRETKSTKRLLKRLNKVNGPRRIGKNKFQEPEQDFIATEELAGSLREIVPQGSILKDRFVHMQKRSLIEVAKPQLKKFKAKVKKFVAGSHKEVEFPFTEIIKQSRTKKLINM